MTAVSFGSFNMNDNTNYFVISKPLSTVDVVPSMYKIARLPGMVKTGETINQRQIDLQVRVIGTSRSDLESKVDTMQQALDKRLQNLIVRTNDSRYYVADCVRFDSGLEAGKVLSTIAKVSFVCYQPFALAASASTADTGTVAMTYSGLGQIYTTSQSVTGGGTVFNYPSIRIYQRTVAMSTTLTTARNSGTAYTTLAVSAIPVALTTRDTLIIGTGGTTQTVTVSSNASAGATTINVNSFTANATYAIGAAVNRNAAMTQIQVTQQTDSQNLYITSNLPAVAGDYIDINCDPITGWTMLLNGGTTLSSFNGMPPITEPTSTSYLYTITCASNPSIQVVHTYTSRWLS